MHSLVVPVPATTAARAAMERRLAKRVNILLIEEMMCVREATGCWWVGGELFYGPSFIQRVHRHPHPPAVHIHSHFPSMHVNGNKSEERSNVPIIPPRHGHGEGKGSSMS